MLIGRQEIVSVDAGLRKFEDADLEIAVVSRRCGFDSCIS